MNTTIKSIKKETKSNIKNTEQAKSLITALQALASCLSKCN